MKKYTRPIAVKLRPEMDQKLTYLSEETGMARADLLRRCIDEFLSDTYAEGQITPVVERMIREFVIMRAVVFRALTYLGELAGSSEQEMISMIATARERGAEGADDVIVSIRAEARRRQDGRRNRIRNADRESR